MYWEQDLIDLVLVARKTAVTDPSKLVVGQTYYSNSYPSKFVFLALNTQNDKNAESGLPLVPEEDQQEWFSCLYDPIIRGPKKFGIRSLLDRGIAETFYNPWMVWESEEERDFWDSKLKALYDKGELE